MASYILAYIFMIAGVAVLVYTIFMSVKKKGNENRVRIKPRDSTKQGKLNIKQIPKLQSQKAMKNENEQPALKINEQPALRINNLNKDNQEKDLMDTKPSVTTSVKESTKPETISQIPEQNNPVRRPWVKIIEPEKEEQTNLKYIGFKPNKLFEQIEPVSFPYVIMPRENSIIKFPRKGRIGRKGYKHEEFKHYLNHHFKGSIRIYDDRFILEQKNKNPIEPEFILINEKDGINIFMDIEIDEPYEGIDDIEKRKATHFQDADSDWNNSLKNRGWIIIRFAEIQIHQQPESCCLFIADVLKSIDPNFQMSPALLNTGKVKIVKQWTKEQEEQLAKEKYREKYLGIDNFGYQSGGEQLGTVSETTLGSEIEKMIEEKSIFVQRPSPPDIQL